ncbi:MAG: ectoine hydroxylase [Mycobacterium sp.]
MSVAIQQELHDPYPTRLDHAIAPIERLEPSVWGNVDSGPLRARDLDAFSARGYLIRPDTVGDDALPPLRRELERLAAELGDDDPRVIREPGGSIRSIFQPHLLSELVAAVVRLDTVLPIARQLLGSDVYIHQARINMMPAFTGTGFYWHSDFETWHAEDGMPQMRAVSCSIALTRNYPYNGSLMAIPGSHRTFYPCVGATPDNHHSSSLVAQQFGVPDENALTKAVDGDGIEQFTGAAGSALWFDCNLLHGSGSNITPLPRSNVFLVFNSVHNQLAEPYAAAGVRPEYLAARHTRSLGDAVPSAQSCRQQRAACDLGWALCNGSSAPRSNTASPRRRTPRPIRS